MATKKEPKQIQKQEPKSTKSPATSRVAKQTSGHNHGSCCGGCH